MSRKNGWLLSLVVMAMLVAACGPQMATPTASTQADANETVKPEQSTSEPEGAQPSTSSEWAVNADDWHVLGSPDAPVTIVDYSDFQ